MATFESLCDLAGLSSFSKNNAERRTQRHGVLFMLI